MTVHFEEVGPKYRLLSISISDGLLIINFPLFSQPFFSTFFLNLKIFEITGKTVHQIR
jgi:hypothetical protein